MLDGTREETGLKTGEGGPDTKEAEALASALNHSAERVQTLWFTFLIFMVYLWIAVATTTHRMLFLGSPLNLPVLNIALPLLGFYILAPIILVIFHFYMLLNLVLLARTAKSFEDSLARAFPEDGEARENFRMRIENTLFVQLLVGGWIAKAATPVGITPFNALDLHGEDLVEDAKLKQIVEKNEGSAGEQRWTATLSVAGRDLTGANFNGADIRHVDFSSAILNHAKLDHVWAGKAHFDQAQLQGASLNSAQLQGAWLDSAQLQGASLWKAQLQGAWLDEAQLQGASLDEAQLQGASLHGARLQGASLKKILVWRTDARTAVWEDTRVVGLETAQSSSRNLMSCLPNNFLKIFA
jgi:uncharacterized protein YjbI with pentapeptide repeats